MYMYNRVWNMFSFDPHRSLSPPRLPQYIHHSPGNSRRGFGIDCAILSCQVCLCTVSGGASRLGLTFNLWPLCFAAGVHQSDPGGFGSGRRGGSCRKCARDSDGGLWGLPSGILLRLFPGHLPDAQQPVRNNVASKGWLGRFSETLMSYSRAVSHLCKMSPPHVDLKARTCVQHTFWVNFSLNEQLHETRSLVSFSCK